MTAFPHDHVFLGADHDRNARRTWAVIALTTAMMLAEIAAGTIYGSMALLADGWHMSTHASALLITALAYRFARKHARNPRFTFGTGKLGDLAAFGSGTVLALVALLIGWESLMRLYSPVAIRFDEAILVAALGLAVNLVSAWLLRADHHHHHDHHHAHDHNLRAAYLHVMADALTSVLAIAALVAGRQLGWSWLDPVIGVMGALVILHWSWRLLRDTGAVLVDHLPADEDLPDAIRAALEGPADRILDLHVWQLGPGHHGAIVSILSADPQPPEAYRRKLAGLTDLSQLTIEVNPA